MGRALCIRSAKRVDPGKGPDCRCQPLTTSTHSYSTTCSVAPERRLRPETARRSAKATTLRDVQARRETIAQQDPLDELQRLHDAGIGRSCGPGVEMDRVPLFTVAEGRLRECWVYDSDPELLDRYIKGELG
jgi:hypothetical protein